MLSSLFVQFEVSRGCRGFLTFIDRDHRVESSEMIEFGVRSDFVVPTLMIECLICDAVTFRVVANSANVCYFFLGV